ncbi:MAG: AbrB/MazE/SpoVT family DNA-binding domain-containing protein [Candidatus Omnitrophica bacterium]|nr:AbrB/MazE/SpoVT family DNA-binding domain-containing protein [Candidatus Omnitrophota bacterium]
MKVNIITIGNSKGIRIPKVLLEQCRIHNRVDLIADGRKLIIKPLKEDPREGWVEEFQTMAKNQDDKLVIDDAIDLDDGGWDW